jgi:hypothetical protein
VSGFSEKSPSKIEIPGEIAASVLGERMLFAKL